MFKKLLVRRLILSVVLAFVCAGTVFALLQQVSSYKIEAKYKNGDYLEQRMEKEAAAFQHYITENDLAIHDFPMISKWLDTTKITTISLYYDNRIIFNSGIPYMAETLSSGIPHQPLPWEKLYPIHFKDADVLLSLSLDLKHYDYDIALLFSLATFFAVFLGIVLFFVHGKTSYLLQLEQQVLLMQGGKLDITIPLKGKDEITSLAENIDGMRQAFIKQKQAQEARQRFSAAMSHDIRTPLAALIGYLDIIVNKRTSDEQRLQQFLAKSVEKANQLKSLTDHLFDYFVASEQQPKEAAENLSRTDFEKLIFDGIFLLESSGFTVNITLTHFQYYLKIPKHALQRVLDNMFSNILKYAAADKPVMIKMELAKEILTLCLKNEAKTDAGPSADTGMGLKNTRAIVERYRGRMTQSKVENDYSIELSIPVEMPKAVFAVQTTNIETLIALGLQEKIVGVAPGHEADFLPEHRKIYNSLNRLEGKLIRGHRYPSFEAVVGTKPDFIYGTSFSLDTTGIISLLKNVDKTSIATYVNKPTDLLNAKLEDVYDEILTLGRIFNVEDRADKLVQTMSAKIRAVRDKSGGMEELLPVFVFDTEEAGMIFTAGAALLSSLIQLAGGKNIFSEANRNWLYVNYETIAAGKPQVVVIIDYGETSAGDKIASFKNNPLFAEVPAVVNNQFVIVSLNEVLPGTRNADCVEKLAQGFYPHLQFQRQ